MVSMGDFCGRGYVSANGKKAIFRNHGVLEGEFDLCWITAVERNSII